MIFFVEENDLNEDELQHYGVLGMKWGIRRAIYKHRSSDSLKESKKRVQEDIEVLKVKANKQRKKQAKAQKKAAKYLRRGDDENYAKYFEKSSKAGDIAQKRETTILHNEQLLKLYNKRIKELDAQAIASGKEYVKKKTSS